MPDDPNRAGDTLGPYRLVAPIGSGAVGRVWRAEAPWGELVAVKVVPLDRPGLASALFTEVRAASRLDHPGVARIVDLGEGRDEAGGRVAWLVSELCAGTLVSLVGQLAWPEVRRVLDQVLRALAHAHARGVVHRDVKLANVLFRSAGGGRAYLLADFGIADLGRSDSAGATASAGTPLYMAPEQAAGRWRDQGPWTDLYALGCLVHDLVGRHPLTAERAPLVPAFDVPDGLVALAARLRHPDPRMRPQRAADVLAVLDPAPSEVVGLPEPPVRAGAGLRLVPLRRPRLCGRERELATIRDALERTGRALLTGPPGSGASALARAVVEGLDEDGARTVVWCSAGEGLPAMIEREHRAADLAPDDLHARLVPSLGAEDARDVVALLRPEADLGVTFTRVPDRLGVVRRWLAAVARGRPVVLWLDDVHVDGEVRDLLRSLVEDPEPGVWVVATGAAGTEPAIERIEVSPLPPAALAAALRSLLDLSPHAAARLAAHAGGSAALAVRLLEDVAARQALAAGPFGWELVGEPSAPAELLAAQAERVRAALGDLDPRPLEVLALLGTRVSGAEWRRVCARLLLPDVERAEEVALRAGLLAREGPEWTFPDGAVAEVLRATAAAEGRLSELASACAAELDERRDPLRRARLLLAGPDRPAALLALRRAASSSAQAGRLDVALGVLDEHDAACPPDDRRDRAEARVIRARALVALADIPGAEAAASEAEAAAAEGGWDGVRADACAAASGAARARGDRVRAAALAETARELFTRAGDIVGVARALALRSDVEPDPDRALAFVEQALEAFGRTAERSALHAGLLLRMANQLRFRPEARSRSRELYERAGAMYEALGDRAAVAQVTSALAGMSHEDGDLAGARATMDRALAIASRTVEVRARAVVESAAAQLALHLGDDAAAEALASAASLRLRRASVRLQQPPELLLATLRIRAGRRAEARSLLEFARRSSTRPSAATAVLMDAVELALTDDPETRARLRAGLTPLALRQPLIALLVELAAGPKLPGGTLRTFDDA